MSADAELIRAWQAGDDAAGSAVVRRLFPRVQRMLRGKVPDDAVADLTQQTFVELSRGLAKVDPDRDLAPLVFTIARRQMLHYYRYQRRHPVDPLQATAEGLAPSQSKVVHSKEVRETLAAALRQLPLDSQMALELRYWEKQPLESIAEVLSVSVGATKMRLLRARNELKDLLEDSGMPAALAVTTLEGFEDGEGSDTDRG